MRNSARLALTAALLPLLLAGCSNDDKAPLPGQRLSVLELQKNLEPGDTEIKTIGFAAPAAQKNPFWPQAGGYPGHSMQNLDLNPGALKKIWEADIGEGNQDKLPLIAQPIVFNNRVYTLDTKTRLTSFDLATGKEIWRHSVRPKKEDEDVISGGVAIAAGKLFVTSGYNELLSIDPAQGNLIWKVKLSSPSRAAPTILGDRVFVVTLENKIIAFDIKDGKQLWDYQALSEISGIVGAASPAVNDEIVVPAFSSGEIMALRVENGSVAWTDDLSPAVRVGGLAALPDIQGLPVLDKDMVFAISFGGKMVALDQKTGQRVWEKGISGTETPWVAGNMIFIVTADSELLGLARDTGAVAWVRSLKDYAKDSAQLALLWNGPILAGGRLILTGPEGNVLEVNPQTGDLIRRLKLGATAAVAPVVANGTLLLLTEDGKLLAYQ